MPRCTRAKFWTAGPAVGLMLLVTSGSRAATLPVVREFPAPGGICGGMAFVEGDLWVWDSDEPDLFYVLDPEDGSVLASYPTPPTGGPTGLAYDGEFVYGVSGFGSQLPYFAKFSPTDGSVIEYLDLPVPSPTGITFDGEYLWVSEIDGHQLVKIDPSTMEAVETLTKEPYFSLDLAWDGQALWMAAFDRDDRGFLYHIDPATGNTLQVFDAPGSGPVGLAVSGDFLFVSEFYDKAVYVLAIPEPTMCCMLFFLPMAAGEGTTFAGRSSPRGWLRRGSVAGLSRWQHGVTPHASHHLSAGFGVFGGCLARWAR